MTNTLPLAFVVELLEAITEIITYPCDSAEARRTLARRQSVLIQRAAALARAGKGRDACRVRDAVDHLSRAFDRLSEPTIKRPPLQWLAPLEQIAGAHAEIAISEVRTTLTDGHLWAHEASCSLAGLTVDEALAEALRGSIEQWRVVLRESQG